MTATAAPDWDVVGDAELARAAAEGDRVALAEIYDRYANRLHDFCLCMVRDADTAADCVQDTFYTAATRLSTLRDPSKLRPWLYAIARNEALRHIRERHREQPCDELPEMVSQEPEPDILATRAELSALVTQAAGGLSDRDRTVLELTYRHGLDGPELAEVLGVSAQSARTLAHRLRETIERSLGALLVARQARTVRGCPELDALLADWDGQFTILMRKRIARHIDSCSECEERRRRLVNPVAMLGSAPLFVPAPDWLRESTMSGVELTCATTALADPSAPMQPPTPSTGPGGEGGGAQTRRGPLRAVLLVVAAAIGATGLAIVWPSSEDTEDTPPIPAWVTGTTSPTQPTPSAVPSTPAPSGNLPAPPAANPPAAIPVAPTDSLPVWSQQPNVYPIVPSGADPIEEGDILEPAETEPQIAVPIPSDDPSEAAQSNSSDSSTSTEDSGSPGWPSDSPDSPGDPTGSPTSPSDSPTVPTRPSTNPSRPSTPSGSPNGSSTSSGPSNSTASTGSGVRG